MSGRANQRFASEREGRTLYLCKPSLSVDGHGRLIGDLRVSVTDRCNFRCQYCMPAEGLPWIERSRSSRFEEITRIVALLGAHGRA